ncbi:MAG TPA: hypothetical protein PK674_00015 [Candidatus Absconditabacterales bacterium]|nr:hypothetical protein [Candidatus Absconditabacterales bacterium]HOQ78647.1 hypothetical protein [Candidatus Absconditabacterales bacterium]HPK28055.1 hypothetical protein [Candidatus Absconditabacterales bacterium]
MKKNICYILSILFIANSVLLLDSTFGSFNLGNTNTILNTNIEATIDTNIGGSTIGNPIREGVRQIIHSDDGSYVLTGIADSDVEITEHDTAFNRILEITKRIINRALGLLSLVALIYLIVHGFIILTATGDDTRYKKGMKGIRNATIALGGIGLSWFIVSFIIRIIQNITSSSNL